MTEPNDLNDDELMAELAAAVAEEDDRLRPPP